MNLVALFAGAKVQPFFQLTKSFFKNFFSLFFELHSLFESGCKITTFFRTTKTFFKKIFVYFNEPAPFSKAGAKVQPFFETTKSFFKNIFWPILMNSLPFRKRVQKYNFFLNWQNISTNFFELFFKWLIISIQLSPEVDKNLLPPSPEGGTGGEKLVESSSLALCLIIFYSHNRRGFRPKVGFPT